MRVSALIVGSLLGSVSIGIAAPTPPTPTEEATITSEELLIKKGGEETVFSGNVVLTQKPYVLRAQEMTQVKATGIVNARGNVEGTWRSETGEVFVAQGQRGRYVPSAQTVELWGGKPRLTRYETQKDTAPMIVTADKFMAYQTDRTVWAKDKVFVRQQGRFAAYSDEAKYDDQEKAVHLWGTKKVHIHVEDLKGKADFESERAWVSLDPKRARLMNNVRGHVIPAP